MIEVDYRAQPRAGRGGSEVSDDSALLRLFKYLEFARLAWPPGLFSGVVAKNTYMASQNQGEQLKNLYSATSTLMWLRALDDYLSGTEGEMVSPNEVYINAKRADPELSELVLGARFAANKAIHLSIKPISDPPVRDYNVESRPQLFVWTWSPLTTAEVGATRLAGMVEYNRALAGHSVQRTLITLVDWMDQFWPGGKPSSGFSVPES